MEGITLFELTLEAVVALPRRDDEFVRLVSGASSGSSAERAACPAAKRGASNNIYLKKSSYTRGLWYQSRVWDPDD